MTRKELYGALMVGALSVLCGYAEAHHSNTLFDARIIEIRGTVVEFRLASPHSTLIVEQAVDGEEPRRWEIESPPWGAMFRAFGIRKGTFERGDTITVVARPHRDRTFKLGQAVTIIAADGTVFPIADVDGSLAGAVSSLALAMSTSSAARFAK